MNNEVVIDDVEIVHVEQDEKEVVQEKKQVETQKPVTAIALDNSGLIKAKDSSELFREADLMLKSNAVPACYKTVPQVIMAIQMLRALKVPVASGLRNTMLINNVVAIWGELIPAVIFNSGELEWMYVKSYNKDYEEICMANKNLDDESVMAVCTIQRKGFPLPTEKSFTIDEARRAGLANKSIWKLYPKVMLERRARSFAAKEVFPDVLSGVAIAEDYDQAGDLFKDERSVGNTMEKMKIMMNKNEEQETHVEN